MIDGVIYVQVFTHGECLSFHLSFGTGPIGLVVADTKAGKGKNWTTMARDTLILRDSHSIEFCPSYVLTKLGAYVEDFIKIQTRCGAVATAAELSGEPTYLHAVAVVRLLALSCICRQLVGSSLVVGYDQ